MKRKILLLLAIVLISCSIFTSCELFRRPQEKIEYSEGLEYSLLPDGSGYIVTGIGTCESLRVNIPPSYKGLPVLEIGERAFYQCLTVGYVTLPDTIVKLGDWCFTNSLISEINIPSSVNKIGDYAFENCVFLKKVTFPETLVSIGAGAFCGDFGLESITLPRSLESLGPKAFGACKYLDEVYFTGTYDEWRKITETGIIDTQLYRWDWAMPAYRVDCVDAYWDKVPGESFKVNFK